MERDTVEKNKKHVIKRLLSFFLIICLICPSLTGCDFSSKHLEMNYESNNNEDIDDWGDNVHDWDDENVSTWDNIEKYECADAVYAELLFDDILTESPIIDCAILDYRSNGKYFDGEMVYSMVNDKFDANSFIAKYAVGTGVIVVCVILNVVTYGASTPIACFIAGAADASVSMAVKGAAFGAATKAVTQAIKGEKLEDLIYGALEGSSDGYMWGAIYGAATGGFSSQYCFTGDTLVESPSGLVTISSINVGDRVLAYDGDLNRFDYKAVTQVSVNQTTETIVVGIGTETYESTYSHPYLTKEGWKKASELKIGDAIKAKDGAYSVVSRVDYKIYQDPVATYTLCVEDYHSFVIGENGIVVHNRCNPNEKYADSTRYFEEGTELAKKYPNGVYIKPDGYPDFSPYAVKTVSFEAPTQVGVANGTCLRGDCYYDFKLANKAAFGVDSVTATPKGFTWHHSEDGLTMELIPTDLHRKIGHDGGEKIIAALLGLG